MCTQCVQMMPMITVPSEPNSKPAFLNAIGIAKMPVPRELFNRCANAPIVLQIKMELNAIHVTHSKVKEIQINLRVGMCHVSVFEWIVIGIFTVFDLFC